VFKLSSVGGYSIAHRQSTCAWAAVNSITSLSASQNVLNFITLVSGPVQDFPMYDSRTGAGVAESVLCLTTGVQSPTEAEDFSSSLCVQTSPGAHPASCPVDTGGKARPGRDVDHSPPSSAEVKYEWDLYLLSPHAPPWRVAGSLYLYSSRISLKSVCKNN
jgi:hypothetical protein